MAVSKAGPATVTAGTNATYTITLTNNGPSDAPAEAITADVPAGTTFVSSSPVDGLTETTPAVGGTGTVTATTGSMTVGASATFTLVVKANANKVNGSTITNTANVSSTIADPNSANNTS